MDNLLFLIPALPFLGFVVNGAFGKRLPRPVVSTIACAAPAASFAIAVAAFVAVLRADSSDFALSQFLWTWISVADLTGEGRGLEIAFSFTLDRLSGVMTLVVTAVGSLIHVYSTGYMKSDSGYAKFFAYLNLFMAAMLVLVLGSNLVMMFLGWEGVGLCSYLLIGFWYRDIDNCAAGIKAFVVNRIGDLGFLLGIFGIFVTFGTFEFAEINAAVGGAGESTLFWIAIALFIGACGKSAQIPLHVWLPDAMAGPTPVSALIHAATMVTSGVYLLARLGPLYDAAPDALVIVASIGALTALFAALIAFSQTDIKKVLAYSTVSQLGYMFLAAGMGAYSVALFHVVTHAFFKALLFLGAGAVIHSLHHEQDMRRMGGLAKKIPQTFGLYLAGALALAGFPLSAGFFSKDAIIHVAHTGIAGISEPRTILWLVAIITAFLTAFYTFRQVVLIFFGSWRGAPAKGHGDAHASSHGTGRGAAHEHGIAFDDVHESPLSMRAPLWVLAALSVVGGFIPIVHFVAPELQIDEHGKLAGLVTGGVIALAGMGLAILAFVKAPGLIVAMCENNPVGRSIHRASLNKFWVDEVYRLVFVRPLWFLAELLFYVVDRALIDVILVHGCGAYARGLASLFRRLQSGRVPTYALWFLAGVIAVLGVTLWKANS